MLIQVWAGRLTSNGVLTAGDNLRCVDMPGDPCTRPVWTEVWARQVQAWGSTWPYSGSVREHFIPGGVRSDFYRNQTWSLRMLSLCFFMSWWIQISGRTWRINTYCKSFMIWSLSQFLWSQHHRWCTHQGCFFLDLDSGLSYVTQVMTFPFYT